MRNTRALMDLAVYLVDGRLSLRHYGNDLRHRVGLESGVIYPILGRLRREGWIADDGEERLPGRPTRRYFRVTDTGRAALVAIAAEAERRGRLIGAA